MKRYTMYKDIIISRCLLLHYPMFDKLKSAKVNNMK